MMSALPHTTAAVQLPLQARLMSEANRAAAKTKASAQLTLSPVVRCLVQEGPQRQGQWPDQGGHTARRAKRPASPAKLPNQRTPLRVLPTLKRTAQGVVLASLLVGQALLQVPLWVQGRWGQACLTTGLALLVAQGALFVAGNSLQVGNLLQQSPMAQHLLANQQQQQQWLKSSIASFAHSETQEALARDYLDMAQANEVLVTLHPPSLGHSGH